MTENNEDLMCVRKRPAMYIGSTGFGGFTHLLKMIIQNLFVQTKCNYFEIDINDKLSGKISFKKIQSSIKDSTNEELSLDSYEFAVLNALCKNYEFTLFDKQNQEILKQTYQKGILEEGKLENKDYFSDSLEIDFTIDDSIWDFEKINFYNLSDEIRELSFLFNDKKLVIKFLERNEQSRIFYNFENGLLDRLELERNWSDAKIRNYSKNEFDNFSIELAFGLSPFYYTKKFIGTYVNFAQTQEHGTHLIGVIKGIKKGVKSYIKKHFPDKKVLIKNSAIKKYLSCAIHVRLEKPTFWGTTRGRLQTPEIIKPISKFVAEIVLQELEKNPKSAEDIIRHFEYV